MTKPERSQTRSRAGKGAEFLTVFAIVWDAIVLTLMVPASHIPLWFKALFVLAGVGVTWASLYQWRQRFVGGGVSLKLSQDPVPHGVPVAVEFQIDRAISADQWLVEAKLESSARNQSGFGLIWSQDYPASPVDAHRIRAEVTLPSDMPSTAASDRDMTYSATLTLRADGVEWSFDLKTRTARAGEGQFASRNTSSLGNKTPAYTPEQVSAARKRWAPWAWSLFVLVLVAQLSTFLDLHLWTRAKAVVGAGAQTTGADTGEFDIRVTNYLANDWALRGRLVGKARVEKGVLIVWVESLDVQPVGACEADSRICEVESVRLLLSQDGEKNFSTLAESGAIAVNTNLRAVTRWSLPAAQKGVEIRMPLPAAMETDGVRLKLQISAAGGSTVYPEHGPYLNLHRALAKARGASDPCDRVKGDLELVRAGCSERLRGAALQDKDGLLLEALKTENFEAASVLLVAGARAEAQSADGTGHTALAYAAVGDDVAMVERLLAAGANINARATAYRQQTALQTAVEFGSATMVRALLSRGADRLLQDNQGQNACDWAKFYKRQPEVQAAVCAE